jgi:hypothetical protein
MAAAGGGGGSPGACPRGAAGIRDPPAICRGGSFRCHSRSRGSGDGGGGGAFRLTPHWCRSGDGGAGCDGGSSPRRRDLEDSGRKMNQESGSFVGG